jgi:hypothetical protein
MELSVNYFGDFGAKCHLLKIGHNESSFIKHHGCQCNLPKKKNQIRELVGSDFLFLFFKFN